MPMKPETQHIIQFLRTAMRVLGYTNREVERKLGVSGGYLTRVFSGVMELRFEHIVDIAKVIGLEPAEIFYFAYPQPRTPMTDAAQRLRDAMGGTQAPAAPSPSPQLSDELSSELEGDGSALEKELERLMMKTFQRFFTKMAKTAGE